MHLSGDSHPSRRNHIRQHLTNSIWDGGTLRVPFPSDDQRLNTCMAFSSYAQMFSSTSLLPTQKQNLGFPVKVEHGTAPLRMKEDTEDVSSEPGNGIKGCTSWIKCPELYCSRRVRI
ncbi:hypothetical protein TNCV_2892221 [Trichonephila clavipes]|nr:hypothetical protein TNCV_2892221 [Trichonephila clavipes]